MWKGKAQGESSNGEGREGKDTTTMQTIINKNEIKNRNKIYKTYEGYILTSLLGVFCILVISKFALEETVSQGVKESI